MGKSKDKQIQDQLQSLRAESDVTITGTCNRAIADLYSKKYNTGNVQSSDSKGDEYMKQADKLLKDTITKILFMTADKKHRKSGELYILAAGQYEFVGQYTNAGLAYEKAAECYEKCKAHEIEAAQAYNNAGNNYMESGDYVHAGELYNYSVTIYIEHDKHQAAARVLQNQADMIKQHCDNQDEQYQQINTLYLKSADLYMDNDQIAHAVDCYSAVAQSSLVKHDYATAIDLYDKCGKSCLQHNINKGMEKLYWYYVLLCSMCIGCKTDDMEMTRSYISDYTGKQRQLAGMSYNICI